MPTFENKHSLQVTAASPQTVAGLDQFGDALLGFSTDANIIVELADNDPDSPVAQAYAAQFYASAETQDGLKQAGYYLDRAKKLTQSATPREQAIIKAAECWCTTQRRAAASILEQVLDENPSDIITAKWAQALHFDTGSPAGILRAPLMVQEACDDNAYLHGMLAFGYEECHLLDRAEAAVERAISINRAEPWAHHAMAHINEARNTLEKGHQFMMGVSDTWTGLTSFMTTHNWWHVCLFLVDMNRGGEAIQYFDDIIWNMDKTCVQDQINAISLLYRLERIGLDVGSRWDDVAASIYENANGQVSVFLDFQFLYAYARAGHPDTIPMMERMEARALSVSQDERIAWQKVAVPSAPGIVALAKGDYQTAVQQLSLARPFLQCIGGSHAQRELMTLFYIDALRGAEQWDRVQQILSLRNRSRPHASWIKNQLQDAYDNLGLGSNTLLA